jgi:hypothetical protein
VKKNEKCYRLNLAMTPVMAIIKNTSGRDAQVPSLGEQVHPCRCSFSQGANCHIHQAVPHHGASSTNLHQGCSL